MASENATAEDDFRKALVRANRLLNSLTNPESVTGASTIAAFAQCVETASAIRAVLARHPEAVAS